MLRSAIVGALVVLACRPATPSQPISAPSSVTAPSSAESPPAAPAVAAAPDPATIGCDEIGAAFASLLERSRSCERDDQCVVVGRRGCGDCRRRLTDVGEVFASSAAEMAEALVRRYDDLECNHGDNSFCDTHGIASGRCV